MKNFIGMDGFIWFLGVVEDRNDPYLIGRVKVRCFGHHTGDIIELPTEDLPWAQVMLPITSAGISGIGQSPTGLVEGSHVFGFFRDGEARQEPVVMGSLPGYPAKSSLVEKGIFTQEQQNQADRLNGFADPNGVYPKYTGAPDTSQLATMVPYNPTEHFSITADDLNFKTFENVGTAIVEPMQLASAFIQKGSSSLFGFVADIITSQISKALGGAILNTVGGALQGFTTKVVNLSSGLTGQTVDIVDGVVATTTDLTGNSTIFGKEATSFFRDKLDVTGNLLKQTSARVLGDVNGTLKVDLLSPVRYTVEQQLRAGVREVGIDAETGLFEFAVDSVDSIQKIAKIPAEADKILNFQQAEKVLANQSRGVGPEDLGTKASSTDASESQNKIISEGNKQVASVSTGGEGELGVVRDKITDNAISFVEDEYQDSISNKKIFGGSFGIPQKSTVSAFGRNKLMNNFLGSIDGRPASWSMPKIPKLSDSYPKKHVYETESGHIMMYDDTENNESIQQRHRSGTQYNMAPDGSYTFICMSDSVTGIGGSSYNMFGEDNIVTIDGRCKLFINRKEQRNNHYDIVIGKGANVNIQVEKGDINMNALDGRINMNCTEDFNIICGGEFNIISEGDFTVNSGDDITLQGDKIFLN
tara:strand:- start:30 stop:1961 length:1932 start_codon:yes stop_codon:yes gene_type:complete